MRRMVTRVAILGFFALFPCLSFALGFGDVKLYSYQDEPLDAEIELLDAENYDPERILVSLASELEFKRRGLVRLPILSELKFQVLKKNVSKNVSNMAGDDSAASKPSVNSTNSTTTSTTTFIRITSSEAIKQPYLEFLMDLSWPNGRLVRGYTLLLDPAPPGIASLKERRSVVLQTNEQGVQKNQESNEQGMQANQANNLPEPEKGVQGNVQENNAAGSNHSAHSNPNQEVRFNNATPPMTIVSTLPYEAQQASNAAASTPTDLSTASDAQNYEGVQPQSLQSSQSQPVKPQKPGEEPSTVSLNKISSQINRAIDPSASMHVLFSFDKSHLKIAKYLVGFFLFAAIFWWVWLRKNFKTTFRRKTKPPRANIGANIRASFSASPLSTSTVSASVNEMHPEFVESESVVQNIAKEKEEKTNLPPLGNEMSLKLDLARHYLDIKQAVNALPLLEDVIARGTVWEKQAAERLLSDALYKG